MSDKAIPCKDCIVFPICNGLIKDMSQSYAKHVHSRFIIILLKDRCSLFYDYVHYTEEHSADRVITRYDSSNVKVIYKTFNLDYPFTSDLERAKYEHRRI